MNLLQWVNGESLSSVRNKINTMFTDINKEGMYHSESAPNPTYANQFWTTPSTGIIKQRNSTNTSWRYYARVGGLFITTKTSSYVATATEFGKTIVFTSGTVLTLPTASVATDGWWVDVKNTHATNVVMLTSAGGSLIDGVTSVPLLPNTYCRILCDGTKWYTVGIPKTRTVNGVLGAGYSGTYSSCATAKNTGAYIDLPPGRWKIELTVLITASLSNSEAIWGRMAVQVGTGCSAEGSTMVGLSKTANQYHAIANGAVVVNNPTTATVRQEVYIGLCDYSVDRNWNSLMGSSWSENQIRAFSLG